MKRFYTAALALWLLCVPVFAVNDADSDADTPDGTEVEINTEADSEMGVVAASDIDMNYVGQLNSFTGMPTYRSGADENTQVYLSESISYDRDTGMFLYSAPGVAQCVSATVMDGMITTRQVSIEAPAGLTVELYRDGELDDQVLSQIEEPGSYALNVMSPTNGASTVLHFTIISDCSGKVELYRMPTDFLVTKLTLNGEETEFNSTMVDFSQEGDYEVVYLCYPTGVSYSLDVTVDHTPPEMTISGVKEDGTARGPVSISLSEDVVAASIYFEGTQQKFSEQVTQTGHYEVLAMDEAGNSATAEFTIMLYLNTTSIVFLALVLFLTAILAVYLIRYRKKMRVR